MAGTQCEKAHHRAGTLARTRASTRLAPASRQAADAARSVAPVVMTSSTRRTWRQATSLGRALKAPSMRMRRSFRPRRLVVEGAFTSLNAPGRCRAPTRVARPRESAEGGLNPRRCRRAGALGMGMTTVSSPISDANAVAKASDRGRPSHSAGRFFQRETASCAGPPYANTEAAEAKGGGCR
jgi:hypothetical protein